MPVFRLSSELSFPPVELAEPSGLLAVGGDLSVQRLLLAYANGIFPWFAPDEPILWWSPDPRLVLYPDEIHISRSLKQTIKKQIYKISFNTCFSEVIKECAYTRLRQGEQTWITDDMITAYCKLHLLGFAHSVEVWLEGELVGGLYGVTMGGIFSGESMFSKATDSSKVALVQLAKLLKELGYILIDCQVSTRHLISMGAREIPRAKYMQILKETLKRGNFAKYPGWL